MSKRKTVGGRIAFKLFPATSSVINTQENIAADIDRAIRRAQAKAWDEGLGAANAEEFCNNPYRGRARR